MWLILLDGGYRHQLLRVYVFPRLADVIRGVSKNQLRRLPVASADRPEVLAEKGTNRAVLENDNGSQLDGDVSSRRLGAGECLVLQKAC